jgi:KDO2-lipid IV(A) lauroyltransferase
MDWARDLRRGRRRATFLSLRTLLRVIGFRHARTLGSWLGDLQFWFGWRERRRLQREIAQVLGRQANDPSVPALLLQAYRVNNGALMEIMAMFDQRQDESTLAARCELGGLDHLREAMSQGRGAIVLATHMGNASLAMVRLAQSGLPVSLLYRKARMMSDGFFQNGLEQYGIQAILANGGIRAYGQMLAALKQGRVLFLMMDQGVRKAENGVMQRFLGKDVPMPAGPAQLARVSRSPVLPMVAMAAQPVWQFTIQPPVALTGGSLEADVTLLCKLTEQQVLQAPQLWSWHHRRWSTSRAAVSKPS